MNDIELRVLRIIPKGLDNRKRIADLAKTMNMHVRDFYDAIHSLIMKYGICIVSTRDGRDGGIYIPLDEEERSKGLYPLLSNVENLQARYNVVATADLDAYKECL